VRRCYRIITAWEVIAVFGMFPSRGVWRRPGLRPADVLVFAGLLALLSGLLRLAPALNAPFLPKTAPAAVSTAPANLPYILFNVIAGASAIPSDLREAMRLMGVRGRLRWRRFILPAIFPAYVTGGITAAGGAWNASIVAEVVSYGHHHLTATGLRACIAQAATAGDFPDPGRAARHR
jgi:ABC-type spermidine/putrescine transport system permease subunit II